MGRHGYFEETEDQWALIRWRGAVNSAFRGGRGQRLLRDMLEALDSLPDKRLIAGDLEADGAVCALGAVGVKRGINMADLDPYDSEEIAAKLDIATAMAREIAFENDEGYVGKPETPEERFERMRNWVAANIRTE